MKKRIQKLDWWEGQGIHLSMFKTVYSSSQNRGQFLEAADT